LLIEVTPVTASIEAPPAIGAGADITIAWQGPDNRNDFITIVPVGEAEGKHGNYTYTRKGNPLEVPAPDAPGSYDLRYVTGQSKETLAALPITITAVSASLEAVPAANAGARVDVTWTGPDNRNDFITVVATGEKEGKHGNYTYTRKGNPLELLLPETPGSYEIRYLTAQSKETLARLPIAALPVTATLDAAPVVTAGGKVQVTWTGPDNHNDFIAIATPDQKNRQQVTYTYTRKGNPLEINAPKEPGRYELRYVTAQDKNVLARLPITVD
jgi:Ca-activated chloride channel family protein